MELATRQPAVSGQFYPGTQKALNNELYQLLENVPPPSIHGQLKGLIVPHAGYVYSGSVAAYAYKLLSEKALVQSINRVILLGPAHTIYLEGMACDTHEAWDSPIGTTKIEKGNFPLHEQAHKHEHSLEVQLPFLQVVLDEFTMVPIVVGEIEDYEKAADMVIEYLDSRTLLIISTDLSHFYPSGEAKKLDHQTIEAILSLDPDMFIEKGIACGKYPVLVILEIAQKMGWSIQLLKYMNSGDVGGDLSSVVGYASFALYA